MQQQHTAAVTTVAVLLLAAVLFSFIHLVPPQIGSGSSSSSLSSSSLSILASRPPLTDGLYPFPDPVRESEIVRLSHPSSFVQSDLCPPEDESGCPSPAHLLLQPFLQHKQNLSQLTDTQILILFQDYTRVAQKHPLTNTNKHVIQYHQILQMQQQLQQVQASANSVSTSTADWLVYPLIELSLPPPHPSGALPVFHPPFVSPLSSFSQSSILLCDDSLLRLHFFRAHLASLQSEHELDPLEKITLSVFGDLPLHEIRAMQGRTDRDMDTDTDTDTDSNRTETQTGN